jgi:hypothetical protein
MAHAPPPEEDTPAADPSGGASEEAEAGEPAPGVRVSAYAAGIRALAALFQIAAGLNVLYVAAHVVYDIVEGARTAPPFAIAMGLAVFSGAPLLAAALLRRLFASSVEQKPGLLLLTLRRERFEIPLASITAVRPLRLPLPGPGVALVMVSGRLFRYRLLLSDPSALLSSLSGALPSAKSALGHPAVAYAAARARSSRGLSFWVAKFGVLPLIIAVILFRLHQYIVYGGPFGQYHMFGLGPYLGAFAAAWAGTLGGLLLYAGIWRFVTEIPAYLLTWAMPARAPVIRRAVEIVCQTAYFVLAPAYVAFRLLL